jgi:hypothetical protein
MSEKDKSATELEECEEVFGVVFPAGDEAAEVVQPGEKAFHFPAFAIATHSSLVIPSRSLSACSVRGKKDYFLFQELLPEPVTVVSLVGDQAIGLFLKKALLQGRIDQSHFRGRSSLCVDGDRKTMSVSNRHDFAALAPLGFTNASAPFLAAEKLPSMKHSDMSKPPRW